MAVKAATTGKPTAAPAEAKEAKPRADAIDKGCKIFLLTGEEVKARRPGTKVADIFAKYKDGITVEKWLEAVKPLGGTVGNLRKDIKFGRVRLEKPAA